MDILVLKVYIKSLLVKRKKHDRHNGYQSDNANCNYILEFRNQRKLLHNVNSHLSFNRLKDFKSCHSYSINFLKIYR